MKNYDIYKMKHAGLTNGQVLNVLRYAENKEKELSLRDIAVVSECRNPALFMERYKQIDDDFLKKSFEEFPSFSILDEIYPWDLSEIYNPPALLFYQGNIDLLELPKVAVVGSRDSSKLGNQSVQKIIKELNNELIIVSGLARGIDTAAHMAALQNGGRTIAVIGTGLDVFYPKANKKLQSYIGKNHLVLSEYGPGEQPLKFHFPYRNRIIAGLSHGVCVIEAKEKSGSLITANIALSENREVFAIPGSIFSSHSKGTNQLIEAGACLVSSAETIDKNLHYFP